MYAQEEHACFAWQKVAALVLYSTISVWWGRVSLALGFRVSHVVCMTLGQYGHYFPTRAVSIVVGDNISIDEGNKLANFTLSGSLV